MPDDVYEVHAVRYASFQHRTRRETFLGIDPHDAMPIPVDYYVWVIRNATRTLVVDTGFDHAEGEQRGRSLTCLPRDGLAMLGIAAEQVADVVITHLHFDHAGTIGHFPEARFHLQEAEMAFATGCCMGFEELRRPYSVGQVCDMVRRVFEGRVAFHAGDREIFPGISVHLVGGHAKGIQCVRVNTAHGPLVLASDTAHYYENLTANRPFIVVHDVEACLRGYQRLRDLAGRAGRVVPGHDPLVMHRYPPADERLAGIVARLDVDADRLGA